MKVIILAGGLGTRISEYTKSVPKPMILVNNTPILVHIMKHFSRYGFNEFIIAIGYKGEVVKKYFFKRSMTRKFVRDALTLKYYEHPTDFDELLKLMNVIH